MIASLPAVLLLAALAAAPAPGAPIRRLGLLVGENDGGPGRARLQYAASDAEGVAQVLMRLGGMAQEDTAILLGASRKQLTAELDRLRARAAQARAAGARTELVFYS